MSDKIKAFTNKDISLYLSHEDIATASLATLNNQVSHFIDNLTYNQRVINVLTEKDLSELLVGYDRYNATKCKLTILVDPLAHKLVYSVKNKLGLDMDIAVVHNTLMRNACVIYETRQTLTNTLPILVGHMLIKVDDIVNASM